MLKWVVFETIPFYGNSMRDAEDGDFVSVPGQCFSLFILRSSNGVRLKLLNVNTVDSR